MAGLQVAVDSVYELKTSGRDHWVVPSYVGGEPSHRNLEAFTANFSIRSPKFDKSTNKSMCESFNFALLRSMKDNTSVLLQCGKR